MRRTTLGIIALVLIVTGFLAAMNGPGGSSAWGFSGVCLKSGLVLGALWLALPQIQSIARNIPRSVVGFFFGKSKRGQAANSHAPSEPRRRPRRRSSSP